MSEQEQIMLDVEDDYFTRARKSLMASGLCGRTEMLVGGIAEALMKYAKLDAAKQGREDIPREPRTLQPKAQVDDYEEVLADHRRLVRELDVLLNGEEGAAKQASLCDIVAQLRNDGLPTKYTRTPQPDIAALRELINDFVKWDKRYPKGSIHHMNGERQLDALFKRAEETLAALDTLIEPKV